MLKHLPVIVAGCLGTLALPAHAAPVYLNQTNTTVAVGPNTGAGTSNNTFTLGAGIEKVINAPSADAGEVHDQPTHIWYTFDQPTSGLELLFTFDQEYDISTLHFWNYDGEFYDVDNVSFTFFNELSQNVGSLSIQPDLGAPGTIFAQDIPLAAPLNVKFVTAFLTGSNGQVDFQNIGFTAEVSVPVEPQPSVVPLPAPALLLLGGLGALGLVRRRAA